MKTPFSRGNHCSGNANPPSDRRAAGHSTGLWRLAAMLVACATSLIATPAALAQSSSSGITTTNSTSTTEVSSAEVLHGSVRVDTYETHIIGRVDGGATLFNQTYSFAYGSGQVAAGITDAQAALTSYFGSQSFSLFGPTLLSSTQSLVSSVSGAPVVTSTPPTLSGVSVTTAFGPTSILIGDLGLCTSFSVSSGPMGCAGGTPFAVLAGTLNINTNANYQVDIFRTITTTDTFNTVASYEIVGQPVPEPSTWALLAGGLALLGWRARQRGAA